VPSYKRYLIVFIILGSFASCSVKNDNTLEQEVVKTNTQKVETKTFELEDYYIMYALELEHSKMYIAGRDVYLKLFKETNKYEYLVGFVTLSTQIEDYQSVKKELEQITIPNIKEEEVLIRLYSFALLKLDFKQESLELAIKLVKDYKRGINYELLGTIYISLQEFDKAYDNFNTALKYGKTESLIQAVSGIEFFQLEEKEKAVKRVEDFLQESNYSFIMVMQLLVFYDKLGLEDKGKELVKEAYLYYKDHKNVNSLNNSLKLLFQKFTPAEIISFLEEIKQEDDFLLELYQRTNQPMKAYELLQKLYKLTPKSEYMAQMAILEFEMALDKQLVLKSVVEKFNIALIDSTNPIYQNYLAYLLIDYDLDVKRGVFLVNLALDQDSQNIAFLDTLAWGEYKLKNCKKAYSIMKKIVDKIGVEDEEIRLHWNSIKECK